MPEITGQQLLSSPLGNVTLGTDPATFFLQGNPVGYSTYRTTRRDPTVWLVRTVIVGAIASAGWNYKAADGTPDERVKFIRAQLERVRVKLVQAAVNGGIDFGWSPFEAVYKVDPRTRRVVIDKIKALLHDITTILVDVNGNFAGLRQTDAGRTVTVPPELALLFSWRMEGTNLYGDPLLENVRPIVTQWGIENTGAGTYIGRVAGARYVVTYPENPGTPGGMESPWGADGTLTKHYVIAGLIVAELEAGNSIGIPSTAALAVDQLNAITLGWKIEPLQDKGGAPLVMEHLRYLDVNKVRGMGLPERTVLEGAAEGAKSGGSETAQSFAIKHLEMDGQYIAAVVSENVVDPLLVWNYGESARG